MRDMLRHCGYKTAFEMLKDNLSEKELMELLAGYVEEDESGYIEERCEEIACDNFEWVDWEQAKEDADEAAYQAYRDGGL
jgi:hypothetical protein